MMEKDRFERYLEKIKKIKFNLEKLKNWFVLEKLKQEQEQGKYQKIYAVYYAMQTLIEGITDISAMIVEDLVKVVEDDYNNFEILRNQNIINYKEYNKLKKMNGLRNRLVHDYNGIIDHIAWDAIHELIPFTETIVKKVEKWVLKMN